MTPEELERMAREAGMHNDGEWWFDGDSNAQCDVSTAALARFAALVRAQALEQAAQACDRRVMGDLNREDMEARACAAVIRALAAPQPPAADPAAP